LCIILIPMTMRYHSHKGYGQLSKTNIILLHTYNLGNIFFAWSILSWIMHRNSSFDCIDSVLQVWYKFLHEYWCRICFLSFASYFKTSLQFFSNWISSPSRIHKIVHFANTNPCFHTSTFKWSFFLNLLIVDWKIPPMLNYLLIYQPKTLKIKKY
jgi:hypothetical protein